MRARLFGFDIIIKLSRTNRPYTYVDCSVYNYLYNRKGRKPFELQLKIAYYILLHTKRDATVNDYTIGESIYLYTLNNFTLTIGV